MVKDRIFYKGLSTINLLLDYKASKNGKYTHQAMDKAKFIFKNTQELSKLLLGFYKKQIKTIGLLPYLNRSHIRYLFFDVDDPGDKQIKDILKTTQNYLKQYYEEKLLHNDHIIVEKNESEHKYHLRFLSIFVNGTTNKHFINMLNEEFQYLVMDTSCSKLRYPLFDKWWTVHKKWQKNSRYLLCDPNKDFTIINENDMTDSEIEQYFLKCDILNYSNINNPNKKATPMKQTLTTIMPTIHIQKSNASVHSQTKISNIRKVVDLTKQSVPADGKQFQKKMQHINQLRESRLKFDYNAIQTTRNIQQHEAQRVVAVGEKGCIDFININHPELPESIISDKKLTKIEMIINHHDTGDEKVLFLSSNSRACPFSNRIHNSNTQWFIYYAEQCRLFQSCRDPLCVVTKKTTRGKPYKSHIYKLIWPSDTDNELEFFENNTEWETAKEFKKYIGEKYIYVSDHAKQNLDNGQWYFLLNELYFNASLSKVKLLGELKQIWTPKIIKKYTEKMNGKRHNSQQWKQFIAWKKKLKTQTQNYNPSLNVERHLREMCSVPQCDNASGDSLFLVFENQGILHLENVNDGLLPWSEVQKRLPKNTFITNNKSIKVKFEKKSDISKERFDKCDKFFSELFPDPATRRYVFQFIFICLTKEKIKEAIYLFGKHNNGKSVFLEFLDFFCDNYCFSGGAQLLDDKPDATSLHATKGCRVLIVDECPRKWSENTFRKYVGTNKLFGRAIFSTETEIEFVWKMIVASNFMPAVLKDGGMQSTRARLVFIYMQSMFVFLTNPQHPPPDPTKCIFKADPMCHQKSFFKDIAMPFFYRIMENAEELIKHYKEKGYIPSPQLSNQSKILSEIMCWSRSRSYSVHEFIHTHIEYAKGKKIILLKDLWKRFKDSPLYIQATPEDLRKANNNLNDKLNWFRQVIADVLNDSNCFEFVKKNRVLLHYQWKNRSQEQINEDKIKEDLINGFDFKLHDQHSDAFFNWIHKQCYYDEKRQNKLLGLDILRSKSRQNSVSLHENNNKSINNNKEMNNIDDDIDNDEAFNNNNNNDEEMKNSDDDIDNDKNFNNNNNEMNNNSDDDIDNDEYFNNNNNEMNNNSDDDIDNDEYFNNNNNNEEEMKNIDDDIDNDKNFNNNNNEMINNSDDDIDNHEDFNNNNDEEMKSFDDEIDNDKNVNNNNNNDEDINNDIDNDKDFNNNNKADEMKNIDDDVDNDKDFNNNHDENYNKDSFVQSATKVSKKKRKIRIRLRSRKKGNIQEPCTKRRKLDYISTQDSVESKNNL